ncbi:MAG TPA: hypothetical protein PLQ18_11645, partial [Plasticicumulans sp.]|nr:hypothetical protein [Plasticicumulans sp.]
VHELFRKAVHRLSRCAATPVGAGYAVNPDAPERGEALHLSGAAPDVPVTVRNRGRDRRRILPGSRPIGSK